MSKPRNLFYAQSGGVTAVINATACGVIQTARRHKRRIGQVYAGRNGIIGALTEDLIATNKETARAIAGLRHTPSGAFGSCRYKLAGPDKNRAEYQRLMEVFQAHDIGCFLYNGGGDSADTCLKVAQLARTLGYPLQAIHIPKTVDNDLPLTDNCPGFGSVAKYIAISTLEASLDVASMSRTSTKVFILEVMGRHAGWIAAAGALAADPKAGLPVLVLFPEIPFDRKRLLVAVKSAVARHGHVSVVVSEGVRDAGGGLLSEAGTVDAFGHTQLGGVAPVVNRLIAGELGYKCHWAVADYLQRAARHIASGTDVEQACAVGRAAVQMAVAGRNEVMPAIVRVSSKPYRWKIGEAPLSKVANVEKKMPRSFISSDGFGITKKCRDYLEPLIKGEDYPPYKNGMPQYVKLKNVAVRKKLKTRFEV